MLKYITDGKIKLDQTPDSFPQVPSPPLPIPGVFSIPTSPFSYVYHLYLKRWGRGGGGGGGEGGMVVVVVIVVVVL